MKILHFIHGLHVGGAETFLKNLITALRNYKDIEIFFALQDPHITNDYFLKYNSSHGNNRFIFIPSFPAKCIAQYNALNRILKSNKFDALHVHMNSFVNPLPVIVAKKINLPVIVHSHNTKNAKGGFPGLVLHNINRILFNYNHNIKIACSQAAGTWMFNNKKYTTINNAIDIETYRFDELARQIIRKQYNIPQSSIAIGMVGRLHPQKNHKKGIEIFKAFHKSYPASKLIIVGDGILKEDLIQYASSLGILDNIVFGGEIQNVTPIYSAMDVLLFPSLYEGLGIVGIEAQASGLGVVASDKVTIEMDISGNVDFLSLDSTNEEWTESLIKHIHGLTKEKRLLRNRDLCSSHYNINYLGTTMANLYRNIDKKDM